jgi:hypothetical protein
MKKILLLFDFDRICLQGQKTDGNPADRGRMNGRNSFS